MIHIFLKNDLNFSLKIGCIDTSLNITDIYGNNLEIHKQSVDAFFDEIISDTKVLMEEICSFKK